MKDARAYILALLIFSAISCARTEPQGVHSLSAPVHVIIDECGTPHIFAQTEEDAFYVLGWIQASYRLFQVDMLRRMAAGRVAEVFPEKMRQDLFIRMLGFAEFSKRTELSFRSTGILRKIKAFVDGFNRYIDDAITGGSFGGIKARIPPQYQILGVMPEKIRTEDVIAMGKLRAFALSSSLFAESAFKLFQIIFGPNFERELNFGSFEKVSIVDSFPRTRITPFSEPHMLSFPRASNNFVVSGRITKTGYSYVEDDPHLPVLSPPVWLPIHIETPTYSAKGFTFPGVPIVIIGGGENVCWAVTVVAADVSDIFLTKVKKIDGRYFVQWGNSWKEAEVVEEIIQVRNGDSFSEKKIKYLLIPDLGTIVDPTSEMEKEGFSSAILELFNLDVRDEGLEREVRNIIKRIIAYGVKGVEFRSGGENSIDEYAIMFIWTGFKPTSEVAAFYFHPRAKDVFEAISFHRFFQAGAQNFVVADTKGNIAYYPHADYPIRNFLKPYFPELSERGYWKGELLDDLTPRAINPPSGYIFTANNDPVGTTFDNDLTNDRFYFGSAYDLGARAKRGVELVESSKFYIDELTVARIMNDTKSIVAERFLPTFFRAVDETDIRNFYPSLATYMLHIYKSLKKWDLVESSNSRETLYFEALMHMSFAKMIWDNLVRRHFSLILKDFAFRVLPDEPGKAQILHQIGLPVLSRLVFRVFMNYEVSVRVLIPILESEDICKVTPATWDVRMYFLGDDLCPKNEFLSALSDVARFLVENSRFCIRFEGGKCAEYRNICEEGNPFKCVLGDFAGIRLRYFHDFPGSESFEPRYRGKKYFPRSMGTALLYASNFDLPNFSPVRLEGMKDFPNDIDNWYVTFSGPDPQKDYISWEHEDDAQSLRYFCTLKPTGTELWYIIPGGASDDPSDEYFALMAEAWACAKEWLEGVVSGHCSVPPDLEQKLKEKLGVDRLSERDRMLLIFSKLETDFERLLKGDYWVSPVCKGRRKYIVFK